MLTPKQICETLEISPTTLRRWANQYLTLELEPGQHRTYSPEDLTTLQNVKTLLANGLTRTAIKSRLAIIEEPKSKTDPQQSTALLALPEFQTAMENARAAIASMRTEIEELKTWKTEFNNWASLPWWKRIFTPPPTAPERPTND